MLHKFAKGLSLVMVIVASLLLVYTAVIGVRLWWCSFCIVDSRNYLSTETADQVYNDANEIRTAISEESEYANIVCNASGLMRCFIMLFELVTICISFFLFVCMKACDEKNAEHRARRSRG